MLDIVIQIEPQKVYARRLAMIKSCDTLSINVVKWDNLGSFYMCFIKV